jgi:hypothetical protein
LGRAASPEMRDRTGKYLHFKGKLYEVVGFARHSETQEEYVVYRLLYGDFSLWVRPRSMFFEDVWIEGCRVPRFVYVGEQENDVC